MVNNKVAKNCIKMEDLEMKKMLERVRTRLSNQKEIRCEKEFLSKCAKCFIDICREYEDVKYYNWDSDKSNFLYIVGNVFYNRLSIKARDFFLNEIEKELGVNISIGITQIAMECLDDIDIPYAIKVYMARLKDDIAYGCKGETFAEYIAEEVAEEFKDYCQHNKAEAAEDVEGYDKLRCFCICDTSPRIIEDIILRRDSIAYDLLDYMDIA